MKSETIWAQGSWVSLGVVVIVLLIFLFAACLRTERTHRDPSFLLTLHKSTFSTIVDDIRSIAMMFEDLELAVIADNNVYRNQRFHLVNLESGITSVLELKNEIPLVMCEFISGGSDVFAALRPQHPIKGEPGKVIYRIRADGKMRRLQYLQYLTMYTDERPDPLADDLTPFIADGKLANLTESQKEICKKDDTTGNYRVSGISRVHYFFNETYFVETNISTMIETLRQSRVLLVVDGCRQHADPVFPGVDIKIERVPVRESYYSDLDGRIQRVHLSRDGVKVKTLEFGTKYDFYYWAPIVGSRLYFVGSYVKFLDLNQI